MSKIQAKKEEKRHRITQSAIELFNELGYANTKIEDIIARAKVGKGTFYLYYKNKEQLVEAILEQMVAELLQTLQWVGSQGLSSTDLRTVFVTEGDKIGQTLAANKEVARFVIKQAQSVSPHIDKLIQEFMDSLVEISSSHFEESIKNGQMDKKLNPIICAIGVIGGIHFTYGQWASGLVDMSEDEIVQELLRFYLNALGIQ